MFSWEINIWLWLGLLFGYFVFDILYAKYVMCVQKLWASKAANISVLMYLLGILGTVQVVDNLINIVPIVAGSWLGTYATLRFEIKRKNDKRRSNKVSNKVV